VEPVRILEEALAGHREKFSWPFGGVVVERDEPPLIERLRKSFPAVGHAPHPLATRGGRRQRRNAVDLAVEQVDGVRALMDHHAPRSVAKPAALDHPWPGEHHAASIPGLAQPRLLPLQLTASLQRRRPRHEVVARIDEHRLQAVEELVGHPQHNEACLAGDRHADLVVDLHAATALEPLFGDEDGDPRLQPLPLLVGEPLHLPQVSPEDVIPDRRPRPITDRAASSGPQPAEHRDTPERIPLNEYP